MEERARVAAERMPRDGAARAAGVCVALDHRLLSELRPSDAHQENPLDRVRR